MMNLLQIEDKLKTLTDQQLVQEMNNGLVPGSIVLAELKYRRDIALEKQTNQPVPPPLAQTIPQQLTQLRNGVMPQQGPQPVQMPQPQQGTPPAPPGMNRIEIPAPVGPAESIMRKPIVEAAEGGIISLAIGGEPNSQQVPRMANGGVVSFEYGGDVELPVDQTYVRAAPTSGGDISELVPSVAEVSDVVRKRNLDALLKNESENQHYEPARVYDKVTKEWTKNPKAGQVKLSKTGAIGVGQILESTGADPGMGIKPVTREDLMDESKNRAFSKEYYDKLINRYKGDTRKAAGAYHMGLGNVDRSGDEWEKNLAANPKGLYDPQYIAKFDKNMAAPTDLATVASAGPTSIPYNKVNQDLMAQVTSRPDIISSAGADDTSTKKGRAAQLEMDTAPGGIANVISKGALSALGMGVDIASAPLRAIHGLANAGIRGARAVTGVDIPYIPGKMSDSFFPLTNELNNDEGPDVNSGKPAPGSLRNQYGTDPGVMDRVRAAAKIRNDAAAEVAAKAKDGAPNTAPAPAPADGTTSLMNQAMIDSETIRGKREGLANLAMNVGIGDEVAGIEAGAKGRRDKLRAELDEALPDTMKKYREKADKMELENATSSKDDRWKAALGLGLGMMGSTNNQKGLRGLIQTTGQEGGKAMESYNKMAEARKDRADKIMGIQTTLAAAQDARNRGNYGLAHQMSSEIDKSRIDVLKFDAQAKLHGIQAGILASDPNLPLEQMKVRIDMVRALKPDQTELMMNFAKNEAARTGRPVEYIYGQVLGIYTSPGKSHKDISEMVMQNRLAAIKNGEDVTNPKWLAEETAMVNRLFAVADEAARRSSGVTNWSSDKNDLIRK